METTNTAEQNLAKLNEILDDYDKKFNLVGKDNKEIEQYLTFSREDFSKLSGDECGEIAASLALFSFNLSKEQNRQSARVGWCESNIDLAVIGTLESYKTSYQTYNEKRLLAINGNSYAKALEKLRISAQTRLSEINFLSNKIDLYIKTLLELQQSKRNKGRLG